MNNLVFLCLATLLTTVVFATLWLRARKLAENYKHRHTRAREALRELNCDWSIVAKYLDDSDKKVLVALFYREKKDGELVPFLQRNANGSTTIPGMVQAFPNKERSYIPRPL